jgi:hypothetical protein
VQRPTIHWGKPSGEKSGGKHQLDQSCRDPTIPWDKPSGEKSSGKRQHDQR